MIDLLQSQVHHPLHPDHAAEVQGQGEVQHRRKCLGAGNLYRLSCPFSVGWSVLAFFFFLIGTQRFFLIGTL